MRRYRCRKIAALVFICLTITFVMGCADRAEDAAGYVQADLDLVFQGETAGAKQFLDASKQDLEEMYDNGITAFVENYLTGTDESHQGLTESYSYLVKQIFMSMRYQVGEGKKISRGIYEVEVQYEAANVFLSFIPKLQEETRRIEQNAENGKYEGTEEEIQNAMMSEYLTNSYELLKDAYLEMEYMDKETYTFTVTRKEKNTFTMDEEEINTFIEKILALDKL